MKKILIFLNAVVFFITLNISTINAAVISPSINDTQYEYLEDGSMLITTMSLTASESTDTITAKKTESYRDTNGESIFSISVTGTFVYSGSSCKCINSSVSTNVYNSEWKISNATASHSGNSAIATATAKKIYLSTNIQTKYISVKLACDKNGNIS